MNPAAQLAKKRWEGISKEDRFKAMSHVSKEGWKKRRKKKGKPSARLPKAEK